MPSKRELDELSEPKIEKDIKNHFLASKHLFNYLGEFGDHRVIFEKVAIRGKLRADALLFTENKGIIGVEFKTEPDTLKRLPRQLKYYSMICNYIFVYCHDSHLEGVEKLLKKNGMSYVGIISYDVFKNKIITGLVREAKSNPHYHLYHALDMLWKDEIGFILTTAASRHTQVLKNTFKNVKITTVGAHERYQGNRPGVGARTLSKRNMMRNYISLFGERNGTKILCQAFIYPEYNPDKYLKIYNFGDKYGKYNESK